MSQSHGKPSEAQGASGNPRAVTRPAVWDRRAAPAGATRQDRASWEGRGWGRQQTRGRGRALLPVGAQPARAAGAQGHLLTHQRVTEPANERSERQGPGCRLYSSPGTTVGRRAPVCSWKGFQRCSHLEGRLEEETGSRRQAAPPPPPQTTASERVSQQPRGEGGGSRSTRSPGEGAAVHRSGCRARQCLSLREDAVCLPLPFPARSCGPEPRAALSKGGWSRPPASPYLAG